MFNRKRRQELLMEQVQMIKPTSKAALKAQCLYLTGLDMDKAEKMYDFLIKDITDIPDVEPESKGFVQNIGDQASGIFSWLRENEDMLSKGVDLIRSIMAKRKGTVTPLPPINE